MRFRLHGAAGAPLKSPGRLTLNPRCDTMSNEGNTEMIAYSHSHNVPSAFNTKDAIRHLSLRIYIYIYVHLYGIVYL